ncbi:MAG: hypothetical protein OXH11_16995, partial [Candidatus Aminicenantes bacterium]|nr:hypothetical protein [Candidatus Aminicenantes bacterium]
LVSMVAIGVALAGLILATNRGLRQDMARMEKRLDGRIDVLDRSIDALESRFNEFQSHMDRQLAAISERIAYLEGLLKGLQKSIERRSVAG